MEQYAMHEAVRMGDLETVMRLIELGVSVDSLDDEGRSPLHVAVKYGQRSVAELLISNNCNIEIKDGWGMGPILYDEEYNYIELLLDRGAQGMGVDVLNHTLLFYVSILGWAEVVNHLLERGGGADVNVSDIDGTTPLMYAARRGHEEVVALLIRGGAQVNVRDKWNQTALHQASSYGRAEVVHWLLKWDGIDLDPEDCDGETPLLHACFFEHPETVKHLLKAGANIKVKNKNGKSALCIGIYEENLEVVRLLVQHGAHFEDEEYSRMFQNTSLSFKEGVLKDVDLCTQSLLNKFHNRSLPALERITRFAERLPRIEKLKLKDHQIHEIENYVRNDIRKNNFRNLERTFSSVLSVLCVQCLVNNQ